MRLLRALLPCSKGSMKMKLFYPEIFEKFQCTGSECKDNCCKTGWDIEIDDDTCSFFKSLDGGAGQKLADCVSDEDGCHYLVRQDGKCPLLNDKGLCSLQLDYGEDKISEICREHPRFYEWFGSYKEAGVGLACEEAVRLLLSDDRPIRFFTKEIDEEPDELEYDVMAFGPLLEARGLLIDLLQESGLTLSEKLSAVLCAAEVIQYALDREEYGRIGEVIKELSDPVGIQAAVVSADVPDISPGEAAKNILEYLKELDYMESVLPQKLAKAVSFAESAAPEPADGSEGSEYEKLAVYFIYRYFLKSARDLDVISKVKTMIVIVFTARIINLSRGAAQRDRFDTVREICKEIEYSADNMYRLSEDSYTDSIFSGKNLTALLGWL